MRCSEGGERPSSRTLARELPESAAEEEEEAGGEGGCSERGVYFSFFCSKYMLPVMVV